MHDVEPVLRESEDGNSILFQGRNLYSSREPRLGAERRAKTIDIPDDTLVIVPSPLLFYGVDTLLELAPRNTAFLCVEVEEALASLAESSVQLKVLEDDRVVYIRTSNPQKAVDLFLQRKKWIYRNIRLAILSGGYRLHREVYDDVFVRAQQINQEYWQNRLTLTRMARLWMRNIFQNTALYRPRSIPRAQTQSCCAVVVGAGPSLESAIGWIKRSSNRVMIFCVDTAVGTLHRAGIVPDVIVVLEGQSINYSDFVPVGSAGISNRTVVAADVSSSPMVLRLLGDRVRFFRSEFFPSPVFDRMNEFGLNIRVVPPLGSVGSLAVLIARTATTGPILLTGLDFSYPLGKSHAAQTPARIRQYTSADRIHPAHTAAGTHLARNSAVVLGAGGREIRTDMVLKSYALGVEEIFRRFGGIYDTNPDSILTGIPVVGPAEIANLVAGSADPDPGAFPYKLDESEPGDVGNRKTFLETELELVYRARDECRTIIEENAPPKIPRPALDASYLYLDFPDFVTEASADRGFLGRIIASTLYYEKVISRAVDLIPDGDDR